MRNERKLIQRKEERPREEKERERERERWKEKSRKRIGKYGKIKGKRE